MNAPIRPSQARVPSPSVPPMQPAQNQFYVYSTDNNHVGPVNAELIARGVVAGRVPEDAYVAPLGSTSWVPMSAVAEIADAVKTARSTPSSMRPSSNGLAAATVVTPPPPPLPRDLVALAANTVVATTPSPGAAAPTVISPNPFAPTQPSSTTTTNGANGPASVSPTSAASPLSQQQPQQQQQPASLPPFAAQAVSPGFAPIQVPTAPSPVAAPQPAPSPLAAPGAPSPSISPEPPKGGGEEKKEEKKPALDPRFKLLPLAIFGAFAFIGVIETAIVLIAR